MSESQLLVLILCLVYLSECVCWVRGSHHAFQFSALRRGSVNPPGKGLGNERGRIVISRVLPFTAGLHVVPNSGGQLDSSAAQTHWENFRQQTRSLGIGAGLSFLLLFVLVPVVWSVFGAESRQMLWSAVILLLVNFITAGFYFNLHPKYHSGETWDRWQHSILIALVPTHTARARDTLGRKLLENFHPLAVAQFSLSEAGFQRFACKALREAAHPLPDQAQPANLPALQEFLTLHGVTITPPVQSSDATQYCPRCHAQFGAAASTCDDCNGLPLKEFRPAETLEQTK